MIIDFDEVTIIIGIVIYALICIFIYKKHKRMMLLGIFFGLGIETIQYLETFLTNGFSYRIIDINDVICNFIGSVVGFLALYAFARLFVKWEEKDLNAFWNYVYKTCDSISLN